MNGTGGVPRIIHQTWKTKDVPEKLRAYQQTWLNMHPGWQHILWTDNDIEEFIQKEYEWFYQTWRSYPHQIQRVDAFRYFVLHKFGGIYADLDMQCLTSFEPLIRKTQGVLFGQENQMHKDGMMRVGNAIMLSEPNHPFWPHVFQSLMDIAPQSTEKISCVFTTTGPSFLHEVYRKHPQGVTVLGSNAFYPIPWHKPSKDLVLVSKQQFPQSWAAHHWEGVWRNAPKVVSIQVGGEDGDGQVFKFCIPRKKSDGYGVIERHLDQGTLWHPSLIERWTQLLQPGNSCLVVGGYIGHFVVPLAHLVGPEGLVYVFEPDARARDLLNQSVVENGVGVQVQIDPRWVGAMMTRLARASKWNPLKPHRTVWRSFQNNGGFRSGPVEMVEASPIDSLGLDELSLLHIEANGEELLALQGAVQTIQQFSPVITIEIWEDDKRKMFGCSYNMSQTFVILQQLGYDISQVEKDFFLAMPANV